MVCSVEASSLEHRKEESEQQQVQGEQRMAYQPPKDQREDQRMAYQAPPKDQRMALQVPKDQRMTSQAQTDQKMASQAQKDQKVLSEVSSEVCGHCGHKITTTDNGNNQTETPVKDSGKCVECPGHSGKGAECPSVLLSALHIDADDDECLDVTEDDRCDDQEPNLCDINRRSAIRLSGIVLRILGDQFNDEYDPQQSAR
jgi:hypothetical protein